MLQSLVGAAHEKMAPLAPSSLTKPLSVYCRQYALRHDHPLRNEKRRVVVVATRKRDHEIQLGNAHENLAAIAGREEPPDLAVVVGVLHRIPQPAVLLLLGQVS